MKYEEALALLIRKNEKLDFVPVIKKIEFDQGGDYQIGDMTWDHDNASITVTYGHPDGTPGRKMTYRVDFDDYHLYLDDGYQRDETKFGFAGFMNDLLEVATENGS